MTASADILGWLQSWYAAQCDGAWEHRWGIRIDTLDNPGWTVRIDIGETALEHRSYPQQSIERSDDDWVDTWRTRKTFEAACGPSNLNEVLSLFRTWARTTDIEV